MPSHFSNALIYGLNDLLRTFVDVEQPSVLRLLAEIADRELANAEPMTQSTATELLVGDRSLTVAEARAALLDLTQREVLQSQSAMDAGVVRPGIRLRSYIANERARLQQNARH